MSRTIETTAQDVDGAIAQGLIDLGVTRDQVTVEILEQPMRRMLNLGTRLARVRLTVHDGIDLPGEIIRPVSPVEPPEPPIDSSPVVLPPAAIETLPVPPHPANLVPKSVPAKAAPRRTMDEDDRAVSEELRDVAVDPIDSAQADREAEIGVQVVERMLGYMGIPGKVTARRINPQRGEARHWLIEIRGENLGLLVGTKGETVAALQYITRLMVSRLVGHHANLVIDVDGYKARREDMLKRLAQRMAAQAIQLKRTMSLEPMPPHERRIVHMTLRNHPDVTTESVGQGDKRKVTIVPRHR